MEQIEISLPRKKKSALASFFYSDFYLLLLAAIVFAAWYLHKEELAIVGAITLGCIILCVQEDTLPVFPILFFAPLAFPSNVNPITYWPLFFYIIPVPFSLVFHFVRFRPKKFRFGKMFFPQLFVSVALLLGGAGAMTLSEWTPGLTYALMLGGLILLLYTALGNTVNPPPGTDIKRYVMASLVYLGVILAAQTLVFFLRTNEPLEYWALRNLDLGWGISNNVATLLLLTAPACFYLALQSKYCAPIFILLGLAQFIAIVFTFSRGGIISAGIVFLPTLIYAGAVAKNKKLYWISTALFLAAGGALLAIFRERWIPLFETTFQNGLDGSGRDKLYYEAWNGFLEHPLFGLGIGHRGPNYTVPNVPMYWYHSTFFQIIGSMGAVGIAAYLVYYVARLAVVLRPRPFHVMLVLGMLGFEGYSMIDTGTFVPIPCMLIVILLTLATEVVNEREPQPSLKEKRALKKAETQKKQAEEAEKQKQAEEEKRAEFPELIEQTEPETEQDRQAEKEKLTEHPEPDKEQAEEAKSLPAEEKRKSVRKKSAYLLKRKKSSCKIER